MKSIESRLKALEDECKPKKISQGCIALAKLIEEITGEPCDPVALSNEDRNAPVSPELQALIDEVVS